METITLPNFFQGDRLFLLANSSHRQGRQDQAVQRMALASEFYLRAGDFHRSLRADINHHICTADLNSCTSGPLFVLEQAATREKYFDLKAIIQRTRAFELLRMGRFSEAATATSESINSFDLDGCREDRAVALCFSAITELLNGNAVGARHARDRVMITDGKVLPYIEAFEDLTHGRTPSLGKIFAALEQGPLSRDELIRTVWGAGADGPSYNNRLYVAIHSLRKLHKIEVIFGGERYCLLQKKPPARI